MKEVLEFLNKNHSLIITIATVILVIITFLYLIETRKQRLLMSKAVSIDTSPKVFIKNIESKVKPNYETNSIEITTYIKLKNCGKTEAKNVRLPYSIKYGDKKLESIKGPFEYLFPDQISSYSTKFFSIPLDKKNMGIVKQAIESNKPINVPKEYALPVYLDIKIIYNDLEGNEIETPYSLTYLFYKNMWAPKDMNIQ